MPARTCCQPCRRRRWRSTIIIPPTHMRRLEQNQLPAVQRYLQHQHVLEISKRPVAVEPAAQRLEEDTIAVIGRLGMGTTLGEEHVPNDVGLAVVRSLSIETNTWWREQRCGGGAGAVVAPRRRAWWRGWCTHRSASPSSSQP